MAKKYVLYIITFLAIVIACIFYFIDLESDSKEIPFLEASKGPHKVKPDRSQEEIGGNYNPIYDQIKSQNYTGDKVKLVPTPERPLKLNRNTEKPQNQEELKDKIKPGLDVISGEEVNQLDQKKFKGRVKGIYALVTSTRNRDDAEKEFKKILKSHFKLINNVGYRIEKFDVKNKGRYYRLMIGPTATPQKAQLICKKLIESGKSCIIKKF